VVSIFDLSAGRTHLANARAESVDDTYDACHGFDRSVLHVQRESWLEQCNTTDPHSYGVFGLLDVSAQFIYFSHNTCLSEKIATRGLC
jgi:hypothetical protein